MLGYNFRNIVLLDHRIKSSFRIYDHDRTERAQSEASRLNDTDFFGQAVGCDFFFQSVPDPLASGRGTSGPPADKYV